MEIEPKTPVITLFDLDGVLIQPGGYRAAVKATINYFARKLGLGDQTPKEEDLAFFEANGVTSEWDMVPICSAILIDLAINAAGLEFPDVSFEELSTFIREKGIKIQADYRAEIERLTPYLKKPGVPAAESLLEAVREGNVFQTGGHGRYLTELLGDTRHVAGSETLRVFQNFILGNEGFVRAYGHPAEFKCDSYLTKYDSSLLTHENQERLQTLIAEGAIQAGVITARPSLAPAGMQDAGNDYSPEAELAMSLTGLSGIPVVGFGTIQFLGGKLRVLPDSLIKPSPVQALAGIAAACGEGMGKALDWAAAMVYEDGNCQAEQIIPVRFTLHIFEDSAIGIKACQGAADILRRHGIEATVKAWGIARNLDKIKALEAAGARIYPDVNEAIAEAFPEP
jgi:hypothetical protein